MSLKQEVNDQEEDLTELQNIDKTLKEEQFLHKEWKEEICRLIQKNC